MTYPFVQASHYTKGRNGHKPHLIVVHTMETPDTKGRAKQVAGWFAGKTSPDASAHYMVDNINILQSVKEEDTAWAVNDWDLNQKSISIEHAGTASQTVAQWADSYSMAEIKTSAKLAASIAKRWGIPAVKLTPQEILQGKSGFCGHIDVTIAKKINGGHTDPGPHFPWSLYLNLIKETK